MSDKPKRKVARKLDPGLLRDAQSEWMRINHLASPLWPKIIHIEEHEGLSSAIRADVRTTFNTLSPPLQECYESLKKLAVDLNVLLDDGKLTFRSEKDFPY